MRKAIIIFSMAMVVFSTSCQEEPKGEIKLVTPEEMQSLVEQKDVQLVDVRTPAEYKEGHIQYAQNIDFNSPTFDQDISKLDKQKPVMLYCNKGGQSAKCSEKLLKAGFIKIYDLQGGITQWKFKGMEIKTEL